MKIGIDCRFLERVVNGGPGGNTGHGIYTYNLVKYLTDLDKSDQYILYLPNNCKYDLAKSSNFSVKNMPSLHSNGYLRAMFTFPLELWRNPVDLFHGMYSVPMIKLKKIILTIFDFFLVLYPQYYPKRITIPVSAMIRKAVGRADKIITGSHFIKTEIMEFYKIPENRIEVIPLGVDQSFFERIDNTEIKDMKERYGIKGEYILAVGDLFPRKNIERLVDAFCILRKSKSVNLDCKLVLTGGNLWKSGPLFKKINNSGFTDDIILTDYVTPYDLRLLYQGTQLFVYPSLYEGFGLPVLEAMASGAPVAISNISSMPEVAGSAGVYFDPYDIESIASAISKIIHDSDLRKELVKSGVERASEFNWSKVSEMTLAAYHSLS